MQVTLKDVALRAGVSKSTASLALNDSDKIKNETKNRVKQAARELDYVPNVIGQALKSKSTKTIGLVIPEINSSFFPRLIELIKQGVKERGYTLILGTTEHLQEEENRYVQVFKSRQLDGAIFAAENEVNSVVDDYAEQHTPVVYIDRSVGDNRQTPVVESDLQGGMYQAVNYLFGLGHKRIGYVGGPDRRFTGYERALREHNQELTEDYHYYLGDFENNEIDPEQLPGALVCFNDETAYRVILYLRRLGLKVPGDISVCGLDNLRLSEIYNPALTTVNVPLEQMVHQALRLLFKMLDGEKLNDRDFYQLFEVELIPRDSTAGPRNYKRIGS